MYFSTITKLHCLFGYFPQFVKSENSHQCKFAYLPPTHGLLALQRLKNLDTFELKLNSYYIIFEDQKKQIKNN